MTPVVVHPDDDDDDDPVDAIDWSGCGLTTPRSLFASDASSSFARVTTLNLSSNGLFSLNGIERLPALRTLDVRFNELRTLDALSNGPVKWTLRRLDASGNAIESVRGLELPALRTLRLNSNALRDDDDDNDENDSAFRGMEALKVLDVADNALTRVPNASACLGLRAVGLSRNALSSLEAASRRLPATVTDLDIRANDVVDVEEFRHLRYFPRLARLWFKGNPMEARAVHYGYDARAVASFCVATLRECDGASVIASSWGKAARTRLFRNDSGELCEDLLGMLSEGVQPWFLGQYLHSVCGRPEETTPKRRASAMMRDQSAMFSVSSFVPLKKESGGDGNDDGGNGFDDDDDNGDGQTFMVEAERVVYANGDAERAPRGLDSTADWLSQIVSDESSDDEKDEVEQGDQTPVKGRANAMTTTSPRVGVKPADEMSVDELRMISPIRQTPPSRTIFVEDNDEDTTRGDSTVELTAFYSMEDEPATSPRGTSAAVTKSTTSSTPASSSQSMRLLRATDVATTDAKSTKKRNEARRRENDGKRDLSGDFQEAQKDILSSLADESFENSPDLRPPPVTPPKRRDPNAFVFTDDSESFLDDFSEDDEDELSLRSFILTGDEDVLTSPQKIRSDLQRAVSDLAESAASPKRVAATAKKIEGMISAIKQSRVRAGDYSSSNSLSTQQ